MERVPLWVIYCSSRVHFTTTFISICGNYREIQIERVCEIEKGGEKKKKVREKERQKKKEIQKDCEKKENEIKTKKGVKGVQR